MTQIEILDFNRRCALFLRGVYDSDMTKYWFHLPKHLHENQSYLPFAPTTDDLKFHSSWDWIMEIVEAIEKTNRIHDNEYYPYMLTIWKNCCNISDGNNGSVIKEVFSTSKKEATVQTIDKFLIWYEQNKKA